MLIVDRDIDCLSPLLLLYLCCLVVTVRLEFDGCVGNFDLLCLCITVGFLCEYWFARVGLVLDSLLGFACLIDVCVLVLVID